MTPKRTPYPFERFFATRRIADFALSPDGESIFFTADLSGQFNLWRIPARGGWPEQLTLFEGESVRQAIVSPDGSQVAFMADAGGDEQFQLFLQDTAAGWPEPLTARPEVQHVLGDFSPDGRYLAFEANAREPEDVDIFLHDLRTGKVRMVCGGGGLYESGKFSPEGRLLLASRIYGNTDSDLYLIDLASGESRNLTAHPETETTFIPIDWAKDGRGFYYLSNEGREFIGLCHYDLEDGCRSHLQEPGFDIETAALAADGRLAYTINEAGRSRLCLYDTASRRALAAPELPPGIVTDLAFATKDKQDRLFLMMGSYRERQTIFALNLATGQLSRIIPGMLGRIPEETFIQPELVKIPSFDGLEVPAWLYRPRGIREGDRAPALLSIHGGPEDQERPDYRYGGFYQYLLSRGIAILAPNIRGSSGFGLDYQRRIHRDWGGDELKDIEAAAKYLRDLTWVDPGRLGVWGGSYGGFAALSAAARLPEYWAAACEFCGPANLVTFVQSIPSQWKPMIKAMVGDAEEDREMLRARSPLTYVDRITAPLMVVQGANDPRVVKAESDQMVEKLRGLGRTVEYLVFEDEGHGFTKRQNQLAGYKAMAEFLLKHLGAEQ